MVIYAMRTKQSADVEHWLHETTKRSQEPSMLKNPFKMRFKKFKRKEGLILVFDVRPLYPNFTIFGWIMAVALLFILGPTMWIWPCIILGMFGYFWTSEFYYLMVKLGLKRAGYSGPSKRVRLSQLVSEVLF